MLAGGRSSSGGTEDKAQSSMRNEIRLLLRLHMFIRAELRKSSSEEVICIHASNREL